MDIKESDIFLQNSHRLRHPWETARFDVVKRLLTPVMNKLSSGSTILDIGCGDGYIIQCLSHYWPTFSYVGVDSALTEERIQQLQKQFSNTKITFYPKIDDLKTTKDSVGLVLLLDVLEHVKDDMELLNSISSWLNTDSNILITVPACKNLYSRHDQWLGHHRRYSKKMLNEQIKEARFTSVSSGYFFSGLFLPRLFYKLIEGTIYQSNQNPTGIGQWKWGRGTAKIASVLLRLNGYVDLLLSKAGLLKFGLSAFALCRK